MAENLRDVKPLEFAQAVIAPLERPFAPAGNHIVVLKVGCMQHMSQLVATRMQGNLAPGGAVIKLSGKLIKTFR